VAKFLVPNFLMVASFDCRCPLTGWSARSLTPRLDDAHVAPRRAGA
jgi:hypothetical protein